MGTEVVFGNDAVFATEAFGDAAFGDAAIGGVTAGIVPFGSTAFGDTALGDCTDLGTDAAFGEDGGLATLGLGSCCVFGVWADFGSPVDEAEASWLLKSVIAPCSAIAAAR